MALHLVTGYKGTPHITADDVGAFNAGIIGSGEYVLDIGNKLNAVVISNNTIKILDGDVVIQGRHITLKKDTYEELTINNGEPDKNRKDLIVVRYTKDGTTGEENAVLAVIQGTSTEGTATDPEYTTGDILSGDCILHEMPLYRIPLTGLTVGTPEPLFKQTGTLGNGLLFKGWNPVSSVEEDTPDFWSNLGSGIWLIDIPDRLYDQPYQWGILYNTVCGIEISQKFVEQTSGKTFRRSANNNGWYGEASRPGEWVMMYDEFYSPVYCDSYLGDGNFGESFKNKISCERMPKMIVVQKKDMIKQKTMFMAIRWQPVSALLPGTDILYLREDDFVRMTWADNEVQWYSTVSAEYQLNEDGVEYYYTIIY